ncbi:MAG: hypothetical protein R6W73_07885 [Candidatus Saliniplasma sp.]
MKNSNIKELVERHENLRERGINLVASENHISDDVKRALSSDLAGRYHSTYYGGTKPAREILDTTKELAEELFDVKHALIKLISGNLCDLDVLFSFTDPGDQIAMMDYTNGGYPLGLKKFDRRRVSLPVKDGTYEIDVEKAKEVYRKNDVKLTILGSSYIPFPHPVEEIRALADKHLDSHVCVFDGSHVLGLIATGAFQDPLEEGADVLIGSTHKSFYGPQGGMILTDSEEYVKMLRRYIEIDLDTGIGLIDNPHVNRIAGLGIAMEELLDDEGYGERVVKNGKALGRALDESDVPMKFAEKGYTESHQIFLDLDKEEAMKFCKMLEREDIFIDITGRMGVAEVTHRGLGPEDMNQIAEKISDIYKRFNMRGL